MNAPNDALRLANEKRAQMKADGIEIQRLTPTEKALTEPSYPRNIRATCYECLGGEDCTNVRDQIAYCTAWACALWHRRPHQHLCADPARWPHKHLDRAEYGEPFGETKRQAALGKAAKKRDLADRLLISATREPGSNTAAIQARCLQCTGSVRADITQCKAEFGPVRVDGKYRGCPLHPVRPYQNGQNEPDSENETETDEAGDFSAHQ